MVKGQRWEKNWQEQYYDGEVEYIDERCVSLEMKSGTNDCIKYLEKETNTYDSEVIWFKNEANKGKFYREPYKPENNIVKSLK
jgi:hypothetical protein